MFDETSMKVLYFSRERDLRKWDPRKKIPQQDFYFDNCRIPDISFTLKKIYFSQYLRNFTFYEKLPEDMEQNC